MTNTKTQAITVEIGNERVHLLGSIDDAVDYFRPGHPHLCAVGSGKSDGCFTLYRSSLDTTPIGKAYLATR